MDMTTKSKDIRKQKILRPSPLLSQAEIIQKINRNTRKSYKLFDLLVWGNKKYEPTE